MLLDFMRINQPPSEVRKQLFFSFTSLVCLSTSQALVTEHSCIYHLPTANRCRVTSFDGMALMAVLSKVKLKTILLRPFLHLFPSSFSTTSTYSFVATTSHSYTATRPSSSDFSKESNTQFFRNPIDQNLFPLTLSSLTQFFNTTAVVSQLEEEAAAGDVVNGVVQMLRDTKPNFCFSSSNHPTYCNLVCSVIWALRHEWELALLVFEKWTASCCTSTSTACWDLMVWVLGQHRRFAIAWRLIRDMHKSSINARSALLIMIQSYAAANCPAKCIRTFQAMEKFRISQDSEALHTLLHALCKNGNIEEAEEFMQLNKNFFPLQTETFNIILNGWCNISMDFIEAKRIWREMSKCCITPDATSYTHMISCLSKAGHLFNSLRLYDEMKKRGWFPCLDVYNSLINVLARDNCFKEAFSLVDKIKEAGLQPDSNTYNSMILPLCEAKKLEEAKQILTNMVSAGINVTTETYHAFVEVESADGTVELLKQMREAGCGPCGHTFVLIISKFLKAKQPEEALRMWAEMLKYEIVPDCGHYNIIVRGLVECGWCAKARKFYDDMKLKGVSADLTLNKLFNGVNERQQGRHVEGYNEDTRKKGRMRRTKGQESS